MNITLSADAGLIKKSREYAKSHNTSLNQLVRDYLLRLSGGHEAEQAANEFVRLANSMPGRSDDGFHVSRDKIYDRHGL
ncbi:MAG: DUF6364 family protein [Mariprofundales bacterium]